VALDGTEALDLLSATPVDGVFMDLVMPGLNGLAVLAQIRNRHPLLPVVVISGQTGETSAGQEPVPLQPEKPTTLAQ
jgi:CheY-like chemotaxis protein